MSTIPTEITAATEGSLDIASIKSVMDGFDPASLLPDLSKVFGNAHTMASARQITMSGVRLLGRRTVCPFSSVMTCGLNILSKSVSL